MFNWEANNTIYPKYSIYNPVNLEAHLLHSLSVLMLPCFIASYFKLAGPILTRCCTVIRVDPRSVFRFEIISIDDVLMTVRKLMSQ